MKDIPEPAPPRPSHDEYVKSEFSRFFAEVGSFVYRSRWPLVAAAFLATWLFLYGLMTWAEGRFGYVNRRLDSVGAPLAP